MKIRLFTEGSLSEVFDARRQEVTRTIDGEKSDYLLGTNETLYIQHLVTRFSFEVPIIQFEKLDASTKEKQIAAERFSALYNVYAGKTYLRQVVCIHLPVHGQINLLKYRPSQYTLWSHEVEAEDGEIRFEIINFDNDAEKIRREMDDIIGKIRPMSERVRGEVEGFNSALEVHIASHVRSRKNTLQNQLGVLAQLGISIRPSSRVPATFSIPTAPKKVVIKPAAPSGSFMPEPTLDETVYTQILRVLHDLGRAMERHPSIYKGKDEESLRDLFLLQLTPHFESVSGETFNKKGKTDILVRHDGGNAFVAECKIWKGAGEFSKAIDQLLSYLTWRDSKTALMLFIRNKELQKVLDIVPETVENHPSFVSTKMTTEEGWFAFELHLPGDSSRAVQVAVMLFHFVD